MKYYHKKVNITLMKQVDKDNLIAFGEHVKKIRNSKSGSLNKIAFSKNGVTSATLSRIENAQVDFKFSTLIHLAHTLDLSLVDLLKDYEYSEDFND